MPLNKKTFEIFVKREKKEKGELIFTLDGSAVVRTDGFVKSKHPYKKSAALHLYIYSTTTLFGSSGEVTFH